MNVFWTKKARSDLKGIHDFIAQDSPYYAAHVIETLLNAETRIGEHPTAGGLVREKQRRDLRQVKCYSYRIIYRILPARRGIHVLTVVHEKRNLGQVDL